MSVKVVSFVDKAIKANAQGADAGLLDVALKVTAQAKRLSPVDEGELKGSIMWKGPTATGGNTKGQELSTAVKEGYIVGTAVEHGVYQEFGTRKMPAQPFLRPSVDIVTNGTKAAKAMADAMETTVKRKL